MATPPDDDGNTPLKESPLYDPAEDELIRQAIKERLASLSPEEGRKWLERMLAQLTQTVIVPIRREPEEDGERG